jgi:hypothetical protein
VKRPREVRDGLYHALLLVLEAEEALDDWMGASRSPGKFRTLSSGLRVARGAIEDVLGGLPTRSSRSEPPPVSPHTAHSGSSG